MIIVPVDLIGAPESVIETLEREWRDTDSAIVLYSEAQRHSPCIRLRRSALDTCQAYIDEGGRRLLELYALLDARRVIIPTQWLSDADTPEALKQS
jgi:molybdopterin-guanine dinucleotide biosynthesis protein A